ncbi:MAG: type VI secretion system protein TssL, long form [Aquisalimonadaceae bacterium]
MDNEKTTIRPRPGGHKAADNSAGGTLIRPRPGGTAAALEPGDATLVHPRNNAQRTPMRLSRTPGLGRNSLTECAATLLCLAARLGQLQGKIDVGQLHQQSIQLVSSFEQQAAKAEVPAETVGKARYLLCALIDETLLNTHWGEHSRWSRNSLLRIFHGETSGGKRVFVMIEEALGAVRKDYAFLELAYYCLSLGFGGKYRVTPEGRAELETIRADIHRALKEARDRYRQELSPRATPANVRHRLHSFLPVWVLAAVLGLLGFGLYSVLLTDLNKASDQLRMELAGLVVAPALPEEAPEIRDRPVALRLRELLAAEIEQNVLQVDHNQNRISIILQAEELFRSGSATVAPAYEPILDKVAKALEAIPGRITVAGHTDDLAIRTARFPSNWHLSLARASAVVRHMAGIGDLSGRMVPEGRAETQPIADNATAHGRARNRRVVIEIGHVGE